uniref:Uncharacterized protein n=1 Tax=Steinernema glaseri TaxID=37863 RepID=A0A1I8ANK0_9BILA
MVTHCPLSRDQEVHLIALCKLFQTNRCINDIAGTPFLLTAETGLQLTIPVRRHCRHVPPVPPWTMISFLRLVSIVSSTIGLTSRDERTPHSFVCVVSAPHALRL